MDIGTLTVLFFVAAFFDAVTVMVIRQGNQQSSPVIFRALVAIWRGSLDQPTGEAVTLRYPAFSYTYQGRTYCVRSVQSVSKRHARRMAEAGTCTIYLNPNHPATFITRKTVGLITLTELALAVAALGATLWIATSAWG